MKKIISLVLLLAVFVVGCSQTSQQASNKMRSLRQPPELTVTVGKNSIRAICGTFSWYIDNGDGTMTGMEADALPIDQLLKLQEKQLYAKPKSSIALDFEIEPNDYTVSILEGINPIAQQSSNGIIILPRDKGLVVYEVHARWKQGSAYYTFSVKVN